MSPSGVYALAALPIQQVVFEPMVAYGERGDFFHTGLRVRYALQTPEPPARIPALPDSTLGEPAPPPRSAGGTGSPARG